jgi:hypothetical protein
MASNPVGVLDAVASPAGSDHSDKLDVTAVSAAIDVDLGLHVAA